MIRATLGSGGLGSGQAPRCSVILGLRRRFLFVHVPKCAGESISALLRRPANGGREVLRKHGTYGSAAVALGPLLEQLRGFTVVRNPFDQLLSFYEHLRKPLYLDGATLRRQYPEFNGLLVPAWACSLALELPFPAWLEAVLRDPRQPTSLLRDQTSWLAAPPAAPPLRVLRFERLGEDFAALAADLGLQGQLPHANASSHSGADYRSHYDATARALVEEHCAASLARWQYRF